MVIPERSSGTLPSSLPESHQSRRRSTATIYIPQIGILGTPVIDPDTNTLYVVAMTGEQNGTVLAHRLHALDLLTGAEKFGGPTLLSDPGLVPIKKLQRTALLLANGKVYVGIGSMGDYNTPPYHGLLFAFDKTTLAQSSVWNVTPTGSEGGIWMSGAAPTVDSNGNLYVSTGNGSFNGTNNYGESVVKLSPSLQPLDYFTPYDFANLNTGDLDLSSAGVVLLPDQNGAHRHEAIACGKAPSLYLVDRDSMGHMGSSTDNVIQRMPGIVGGTATDRHPDMPCWTSPVVWGQNVYYVANGDVIKQFTLDPNTGLLPNSATQQGSFAYTWPGSQVMLSANGSTNGILWTFDNGAKTLRANDASTLNTLYVSPAIPSGGLKWTTPTVANGHVYVGGANTVVAFTTK